MTHEEWEAKVNAIASIRRAVMLDKSEWKQYYDEGVTPESAVFMMTWEKHFEDEGVAEQAIKECTRIDGQPWAHPSNNMRWLYDRALQVMAGRV